MVGPAEMRRFWDARAEEDAFFFVDNRLEYRHPDVDRFWADGERALAQILDLAGVEVRPGDTVVDVGCGVGRLSRALAARAARVLAIDVSAAMLERARSLNAHLDNVEWIHGDGTSLAGIGDGSANALVSHVVFQHIPDPAVTLGYVREMGRVLRPDGWAAFQVSNDPSVHRPREEGGLAARLARLAGRRPKGTGDPAWLGSAIDLGELEEAAVGAGMAVERVTGEGTQYCVVTLRRGA